MNRAFPLALLAACNVPSGTPTDGTDTGTPGEPPIEAGTETVSTSWDVDLYTLYQSPTIPMFDTLGGLRKLDGMTIEVDHTAVMTVDAENGSDFALTADDWTHEFYFQTIIQLGTVDEGEDVPGEGPPFFGPGAFLAVQSTDLAADDGVEGSGDDFRQDVVTEQVQFEAHYDRVDTESYLEAMIGEGELQLVVGGFSESWVYWADDVGTEAILYAGASALQYSGTMTVTYEFSPVEN